MTDQEDPRCHHLHRHPVLQRPGVSADDRRHLRQRRQPRSDFHRDRAVQRADGGRRDRLVRGVRRASGAGAADPDQAAAAHTGGRAGHVVQSVMMYRGEQFNMIFYSHSIFSNKTGTRRRSGSCTRMARRSRSSRLIRRATR